MHARSLGRISGDFLGYVQLFREAPESERPSVPALRNHLVNLLDAITKDPEAQSLPADEVEEVRFALVAWADEAILRSDWARRDEWVNDPLQLQLFRTNRAGDEFYDRLARLRPEQYQARGVFFLCLALGFEGRYAGQDAERAELMRQQFQLLRVAGHAIDAGSAAPLAPPAYELEMKVQPVSERALWPVVLAWFGGAAAVFALLWIVLRVLAGGVQIPSGT